MDKNELRSLLRDVSEGRLSPDDAVMKIKTEPYRDIGYAKVDMHRGVRQGINTCPR